MEERRQRIATAVTSALGLLFGLAILSGLVVQLLATRHPRLADAAPVTAPVASPAGPGMEVCGTSVKEPTTFPVLCGGGADSFNNIRWTSWGPRTAFGVGEYWIEYAAGSSEVYPVRLQLTASAGAFTRLRATFAGRAPTTVEGQTSDYRVTSTRLVPVKDER